MASPRQFLVLGRIGAMKDQLDAPRRLHHVGLAHGIARHPVDMNERWVFRPLASPAPGQRADLPALAAEGSRRRAADAAGDADDQCNALWALRSRGHQTSCRDEHVRC